MAAKRFHTLPHLVRGDAVVVVASTPRARLLGLAGLDREEVGELELLIPGCRAIHTFGMRFALHVEFLDGAARRIRVEPSVAPRRMLACRAAVAVLERAA